METRAQARQKKNKLEAMPEVVMRNILNYCDFNGILSLRKSCRRFRNLVDIIHPNLRVKIIDIKWSPEMIYLSLKLWNNKFKYFFYENQESQCVVRHRGKHSIFKNTSAAEAFARDFKILLPMLAHQKIPIETAGMSEMGNGLPNLLQILTPIFRESPRLPVKSLSIHTTVRLCHDETMSLLSLVSPEFLEDLLISQSKERNCLVDMNTVVEMEQWKRLKSFNMSGFWIDHPTRVLNIIDSSVMVDEVLPEQALLMKETFRNSPEFVKCFITCLNEISPETKKAISRIEKEDEGWMKYHFTTSTPGKVLRVEQWSFGLMFTSCDSANLGENDVVLE